MDILRRKSNGLQPGGAHLVDSDSLDGRREAGKDGGLAGRSLPDGALEDIPHVNIGDLADGHFGLFERGLDGDSTELWTGNAQKRAIKLKISDNRPQAGPKALEMLIQHILWLLVSEMRSECRHLGSLDEGRLVTRTAEPSRS